MSYDPDAVYNRALRGVHINRLRDTPVLFGNGEDDDLPAIRALFSNQDFFYNGTLCRPGEPFEFQGKPVALSCGSITLKLASGEGERVVAPWRGHPAGYRKEVIVIPTGCRTGNFFPSLWRFGLIPRPG